MIALTVSCSARGLGRLVMIVVALAATAVRIVGTISTPALASAAPPLGIEVVADHPPAGGGEVLRERAAHDAEADDADRTLLRFAM